MRSRIEAGGTNAGILFPSSMVLRPVRRNPIELPGSTVQTVMERELPVGPSTPGVIGAGGRVSVVVVTFNNLLFSRMCIESLLATTSGLDCEHIVVDNASTDGTATYLRTLAGHWPSLHVISNERNRGFAPAANRGLAASAGDYLVLLNNDTILTGDWIDRLIHYLDEPEIGLIGPVTNRSGNEAQIPVSYQTYGEMASFAAAREQSHRGKSFEIPVLTMFCAAMRRDVYGRVGPLDERFELGFFEDDDYSLRMREAGYRTVCAEDAFVHHFGQASFGLLAPDGRAGMLFHENRKRWEIKWGRPWQGHQRRVDADYEALVSQIRDIVTSTVPERATLAVVSKGDSRLLEFPARRAVHFSQGRGGEYAGFHPRDSDDARLRLDQVRKQGVEFLLIPAPSLWWLDHYQAFGDYLRSSCSELASSKACRIFDLREARR